MRDHLVLSAAVADARASGVAIVALESTILTHGLPLPENLATAQAVEDDVRAAGAVPATIAVIGGAIRVGLDAGEIEALVRAPEVRKLSRADLAVALSEGWTGATTVAATMICARLAGIDVFATGGIGGVHRGAETTFDISADLRELAETPVCVVASGAKAILDIPKTLEVLETLGVPVVTVGQDFGSGVLVGHFGLASPLRIDEPGRIAAAFSMRRRLGLAGGMLVANPVPRDAEIAAEDVAPAIEAALAAARYDGIVAKQVTPFLLARIGAATAGRALAANVALVRANAVLAAAIAQELRSAS